MGKRKKGNPYLHTAPPPPKKKQIKRYVPWHVSHMAKYLSIYLIFYFSLNCNSKSYKCNYKFVNSYICITLLAHPQWSRTMMIKPIDISFELHMTVPKYEWHKAQLWVSLTLLNLTVKKVRFAPLQLHYDYRFHGRIRNWIYIEIISQ